MTRRFAYRIGLGLIFAVGISLGLGFYLKKSLLAYSDFQSLRITDRAGSLLRIQLSTRQGTSLWADLKDISPYVVQATLAAEDKRFFHHPGIDIIAILRALRQNMQHHKIISGGSTLTQQLIRTIQDFPRDIPHKIIEALEAVLLESVTPKKTILTHFLNRAPYGNQCYGVGAAARLYFNKPPEHLSLAEAAFLAGLPQSPNRFNPYLHFEQAKERQRDILSRMLAQEVISPEEFKLAVKQEIVLAPKEPIFFAPHFCDWIVSEIAAGAHPGEIRTTIDLSLQQDLEELVATYVKRLKKEDVTNAAVVVLDNQTRDVRALVGSANYFDDSIDGQVNGALAPRPPGSTWKPFTYGIALEQGMPASKILPDLPLHAETEVGDFAPRNYDESFHGPVRFRTALACSYNIPAVWLLEQMGPEVLLNRLHKLGFTYLVKPSSYYGLGLTLGGAEASLLQLTQAYASLANRGLFQKAKTTFDPAAARSPETPVFSPAIAFLLTDIISDNDARSAAFGVDSALNLPFQCAVKTGTSKNYRDSLTIGYTTGYTVGVWVGNFNGKPMKRIAGSTGAAVFFRDIMFRLHRDHYPANFQQPAELLSLAICPQSGLLPTRSCRGTIHELFLPGTQPAQPCDVHQKIKIDIRNGLIASDGCGDANMRTEVFEVYDPIYRFWMDEHNIPQPPAQFSPLCLRETADSRGSLPWSDSDKESFEISFPNNGDVFVIDPVLRREYQTLLLKPKVGHGIEIIEWLVDGTPLQSVKHPFTLRWVLAPGEHQFKIRTKSGAGIRESQPVMVKVL